jgi:subtilisin family serine protease
MGDITCPVNSEVDSLISNLQDIEVATIVATGNDADKKYADYPACVEDAVAVSAADNTGNLVYVSNVGPNTDFAAEAPTTSEATARLAAKWAMMYNGSYDSTYDLMVNSGIKTNHHSAIFVP